MATGLLERREVIPMELNHTIPQAENLPRPGPRAGDCPTEFRMYLLGGDHWRVGKRVRGERARFSGFALHRSGGGSDGQEGPMQFDGGFLEFLEQSILEGKLEKGFQVAAMRRAWIEDAMRRLSENKRAADDIEALRYYLPPMGHRNLSVVQMAAHMRVSTETLRNAAHRGVQLVWEEVGGAW